MCHKGLTVKLKQQILMGLYRNFTCRRLILLVGIKSFLCPLFRITTMPLLSAHLQKLICNITLVSARFCVHELISTKMLQIKDNLNIKNTS